MSAFIKRSWRIERFGVWVGGPDDISPQGCSFYPVDSCTPLPPSFVPFVAGQVVDDGTQNKRPNNTSGNIPDGNEGPKESFHG
ncbi:hypothetical protein JTE90_001941 [Oedothorax gibbosus]|uniref:Uncharacterized protein n=1 Tax=Oedothorax gibbosus TaxID=931172 RepID=A0AAV6VTU8_9ARAC|nr:hypothetical protein JTE90_001941 [Oedothorax gibbosus]